VAKGSAKKPKQSKCRGSGAPLEGADWVRIGGSKWLREIAVKQGKHIAKEYAEKSGADFEKGRAERQAEKDKAPVALALAEAQGVDEDVIPDAEAPEEEILDANYADAE